MSKARIVKVMDIIIGDCLRDVESFEHAPFSGATVGVLHGILEAKIEALAEAIKELAEETK